MTNIPKIETKEIIADLKETANRIISSYKLVMSLKDKQQQGKYKTEIAEMIDVYNFLEDILRDHPKAYKEYIKENGKPLDFIERSIKKELKIQ